LSDYSIHFRIEDLSITQYLLFKKFTNFNLVTKILFYISFSHGIFGAFSACIYYFSVLLPLNPRKILKSE